VLVLAMASTRPCRSQAGAAQPTRVAAEGDSMLSVSLGGQVVRVTVSTAKVDIGKPGQSPPRVQKTNCTYSRYPCSQVTNLSITRAGKELIVPRSVFADLADIGTMVLEGVGAANVLTLYGGDGSEGYKVRVVFDTGRVKKREVYASEANALLETTTYMPPPVLN